MTKLELWAKGIIAREGYFAPGENPKYPDGTLAWKNKSPGNLIFGPLAQKYGSTAFYHHPITGHDFAIFPTYEQGFQAMVEILRNAATGKSKIYSPDWTLIQFFTKYSPIRDKKGKIIPNVGYAESVAKIIGVPASTKIKDLLEVSDSAPSENDEPGSNSSPTNDSGFTKYSQNDPRWKDFEIGDSGLKMKDYGCTTSCVATLGTWFGEYKSPGELCRIQKLYTPTGLIIWKKIDEIYEKMKFFYRFHSFSEAVVDDNLLHNPDRVVLLQVNNKTHWVSALKKVNGGYLCSNPFPYPAENKTYKFKDITGFAVLAKK